MFVFHLNCTGDHIKGWKNIFPVRLMYPLKCGGNYNTCEGINTNILILLCVHRQAVERGVFESKVQNLEAAGYELSRHIKALLSLTV